MEKNKEHNKDFETVFLIHVTNFNAFSLITNQENTVAIVTSAV